MFHRDQQEEIQLILQHFPVLGLVGPRQVGKTTLAKSLMKTHPKAIYLDMESPSDFEKLENAETYFQQFEDRLVIIDEIQLNKALFPIIRSAVDRDRRPARFVVLGSASPDLIRSSAESLAGRIAYVEIRGLNIREVPEQEQTKLWLTGGYPDPYVHDQVATLWKKSYIQTYLERDLPMLGLSTNSVWLRRLWQMLAHLHGHTVNYADLAKSLEVDAKTIKRHIDFLEAAYLIRQLPPCHANTKKRLVKSKKLYFRDSGLLHHMLGIRTMDQLLGHPKMGVSWEGFVIEQLHQLLPEGSEMFHYRTHSGSEIDLVVEQHGQVSMAIEIKFGDRASLSRGNTEAITTLDPQRSIVIKQSGESWTMKNGAKVIGLREFVVGL